MRQTRGQSSSSPPTTSPARHERAGPDKLAAVGAGHCGAAVAGPPRRSRRHRGSRRGCAGAAGGARRHARCAGGDGGSGPCADRQSLGRRSARGGVRRRPRGRARRELAGGDSRTGLLRVDPGSVGRSGVARQERRPRPAGGAVRAGEEQAFRARRGRPAARELRALRGDRGVLPGRGLHAKRPAHAKAPDVSGMLMIERQPGAPAIQPWILDGTGRRLQGQDHDRRLSELRSGLVRHPRARATRARASRRELAHTLSALHEPDYLRALARCPSSRPVLMAEFAAPGMAPDTPVCAQVTAAAFAGVRSAIAAAKLILDGERFAYALCGPPGHHAGPGWLGGCCYLNNAAAAAHTLLEADVGEVAILDLDIHYPNGTAAIAARLGDTSLHSLHAWPAVNVPSGTAQPCSARERIVEFAKVPSEECYLQAVADSIEELARSATVLVLSL